MEHNDGQIRAGIDAGTAHTRCVVVEWIAGRPRLRAASVVPSRGWQYGRIRNPEVVAGCIAAAAMAAGIRAGVEVKKVTAGYAEAFGQMEELSAALELGGVEVVDYVPEAEAAMLATTSLPLREVGISTAVIGVDATEIAYIDLDGGPRSSSIQSGAYHFTEDLANLLQLPLVEAEHLKLSEGSLTHLAAVATEAARPTPVQKILQTRAKQFFQVLGFHLEQLSGAHRDSCGVILSGGGAILPGLCSYAESILKRPVRLGQVVGVANWPLELSSPGWTTAAGLALYGGSPHAW